MPPRRQSTTAPIASRTSTDRPPEPPPVELIPGSQEEAEHWLDIILGGKDLKDAITEFEAHFSHEAFRDPDGDPRNWQSDYPHENGNYLNRCTTCSCTFLGHKRRTTCRACHETHEQAAKPSLTL